MAFVHDDVTKVVAAELFDDALRCRALDAREDMLPLRWLLVVDEKFTKCAILQCMAECRAGLLEQLFSVRQKKQTGRNSGLGCEPNIVERSNDGLACAGGRDDKIATAIVKDTLSL